MSQGMDNRSVTTLARILVACQGAQAEIVARKHASRCTRRREFEWAQRWLGVAERIAHDGHSTDEDLTSHRQAG
jgi:hypothetical protein